MAKPLGVTLPLALGANGYFSTTTDPLVQVRSNLTNLLLTRKGERPFQPDFGCDITHALFEFSTNEGLAQIRAEVQTAVTFWMPFVRINEVRVERNADDEKDIIVYVYYTVTTLNITDVIRLVF